jgi:hypothetical protein
MTWRKASYSGNNGGNCVEVGVQQWHLGWLPGNACGALLTGVQPCGDP